MSVCLPFKELEWRGWYGWVVLVLSVGVFAVWRQAESWLTDRMTRQEDSLSHKDDETQQERQQAVVAARERQQVLLARQSEAAARAQAEREERRRAERLALLEKYGEGGSRLGNRDTDFLPLNGSGGGGVVPRKIKPPRSCCGSGCG